MVAELEEVRLEKQDSFVCVAQLEKLGNYLTEHAKGVFFDRKTH